MKKLESELNNLILETGTDIDAISLIKKQNINSTIWHCKSYYGIFISYRKNYLYRL